MSKEFFGNIPNANSGWSFCGNVVDSEEKKWKIYCRRSDSYRGNWVQYKVVLGSGKSSKANFWIARDSEAGVFAKSRDFFIMKQEHIGLFLAVISFLDAKRAD